MEGNVEKEPNFLDKFKTKQRVKPIKEQPKQAFDFIIEPQKTIIGDVDIIPTQIIYEKDSGDLANKYLKELKVTCKLGVKEKHNQRQNEEKQPQVIQEQPIILKKKKVKLNPIIIEEDIETNKQIGVIDELGVPVPVAVAVEPVPLVVEKIKTTRAKKLVSNDIIPLGPEHMIQIGDTSMINRLPQVSEHDMEQLRDIELNGPPKFFMNNREYFIKFINEYFAKYVDDSLGTSDDISCDNIGNDSGSFDLLKHQKLVRDYINLYTPYRGLLLYHGLGSGKTCSSVAIAEGMKSSKKVVIMTPASLERNYMEEIKKCGDHLFRVNQYWEFINTDNNRQLIEPLSAVLGLTPEYIKSKHGAWLVNVSIPEPNILTAEEKILLNQQLDTMIEGKYSFFHYNGVSKTELKRKTNNYTKNIFDHSCVIIDEAHNLISRIVNKINKKETKESVSLMIYKMLLTAKDCRIVLLSGTPIINYPNEIGVLFNILRGYIKSWTFSLRTSKPFTKEDISLIFAKNNMTDYIDYNSNTNNL